MSKASVQLVVLFATLALFLITNTLFAGNASLELIPVLIAIVIVAEIFIFVGMEIKTGAREHGWKHEVVDTFIALFVAIAVWYGAAFLLDTASPVSGVVSCSMLPNLYRGDFILVQGATPVAYEIEMTLEELDSLTDKSMVTYDGKNASMDGSIFSYCILSPSSDVCKTYEKNPEKILEKKGVFTYRYELCSVTSNNGVNTTIPCLKSITHEGTEYLTNFSNDIIVYTPPPGFLYSSIGDIVHRAMFKINVDGKSYYLTRGDNNPILDLQVYDYGRGLTNPPIAEEHVNGKVIGRIPILGYFKLFIAGYLHEDPQCRSQLQFTHV
jgi:signal peptidase I